MRIRVNGRELDLPEGAAVADALRESGAPQAGVAVALDGAVVPRGSWASTTLHDGATVEVLTAVQGG